MSDYLKVEQMRWVDNDVFLLTMRAANYHHTGAPDNALNY